MNGLPAEQEITDWSFGLVRRDRTPKKSFFALQKKLGQDDAALPHHDLPRTPFVSVIVCSYNGGKTLAECLESLGKINYPAYEAILVDDGSTDNTPEIAARFPQIRYIRQENHGLSYARNAGAAAAQGEVLAYTDSDCMADPDWLYYLVGTLLSGDYAGVGGPEHFAAGGELGAGLRRGGARRAEPRPPHRHRRGAHSGL